MDRRDRAQSVGLFLTALATLLVELLDSRLLSVLTWYHLSFIAISLAMLGGASGAVLVFLAGDRLNGDRARQALSPLALLLAVTIPVTHVALIRTRIPTIEEGQTFELMPLVMAIVLLGLPFLISGAVITLALTRCGGHIGRLYASDLLGAAAGCALIVPLLDRVDMLSAALLAAAAVAIAAHSFARFAETPSGWTPRALAAGLIIAAVAHVAAGAPIGVAYPRGHALDESRVARSWSNAYSHISIGHATDTVPYYWGVGRTPRDLQVHSAYMLIDGGAGTALTKWDGEPEGIAWVKYDITSLPYHLRSGNAAVIGVGGGRDILSALEGGSRHVTGIEINEIFVDVLQGPYRDFAGIADRPDVTLVNDEARSYLTRSDERFDVLQMSLVDTWASTGAGAFTLSENALYTVEAWRVFFSRLTPNGLFSSSRWYSPDNVSETSRLLSLCVETLLDLGTLNPAAHIALVSVDRVATLLVSPSPLSARDKKTIRRVSRSLDFEIHVLPGQPSTDPRLAAIVASRSNEALAKATEDAIYDYTAPRDARPFFFNMLKPASLLYFSQLESGDAFHGKGGVIWGNVRATFTLFVLLAIAMALTLAIIGLPLAVAGLPSMPIAGFALSLGYFSAIGYGFMSLQIPLLQRFSVFLGHPIYTYAVILFCMILFAGLGSGFSDRLQTPARAAARIAAIIAALALLLAGGIQHLIDATITWPLAGRIGVVALATSPISFLLGFCFPLGLRLVERLSPDATAWMWGVNGASGVLASIVAVVVSMWFGIQANFIVAAACYGALVAVAPRLARQPGAAPA